MSMNKYDKMEDYVTSVYHVYGTLAQRQNADVRTKSVATAILNYAREMASKIGLDLTKVDLNITSINLIPVFEYIAVNRIELLDFSDPAIASQIDVTNPADIERFVLTHVYYITQRK